MSSKQSRRGKFSPVIHITLAQHLQQHLRILHERNLPVAFRFSSHYIRPSCPVRPPNPSRPASARLLGPRTDPHLAQAGPSSAPMPNVTQPSRRSTKLAGEPARPQKIAKNKRLPATMITPAGTIAPSKKSNAKDRQESKKQKARSEKGREKAVELAKRLEEKVKGREERKVSSGRLGEDWDDGKSGC